MRIIKRTTLTTFTKIHAKAGSPLDAWRRLTEAAKWKNFIETRKTFPNADQVKVESGRTVTIFNVGGNNFRLVTAIHYNTQIVYILRFLTHAEYDKATWKNEL